jgi:DnaJ domain
MSDDTYYTVLEVPETATQAEIKAAYRNLIKQVHPDTLATLPRYLKGIAEDKAKEMTEAYSVLSNVTKRRQYDRLIAEHRQQSAPSPPPSPPNAAAPPPRSHTSPPAGPGPQVQASKHKYNWETLKRWPGKHPERAVLVGLLTLMFVVVVASDSNTPASPRSNATVTNANAPAPAISYSAFPCDARYSVSPIDGKPCPRLLDSMAPTFEVVDAKPLAKKSSNPLSPGSGHTIAGTYFGVVHNKTANLTASFGVLFQNKDGVTLDGCMDVKPPLYGGGLLHGVTRGSHIDFAVNNIRFQGEASDSDKEVAGSYIVSKSEGLQELGDFHLARQMGAYPEYRCTDGTLTEVQTKTKTAASDSQPWTRYAKAPPKPVAVYAIVTGTYATLDKRCAFLPSDNYGRCGYKPETLARLQRGDRLRVLSPKIRAENGEDIRKVRTEQGWEGWIDISNITLETDAFIEKQ